MRLVCPKCGAQYEVGEEAIPAAGRDVQCSDCGEGWFQTRPASPLQETLVAARPLQAVLPPVAEPSALPADLPPGPSVPQRRPLDEKVMAILREEALRETAARRVVAAGPDLPTPLAPIADEGSPAVPEPTAIQPPVPTPERPERAAPRAGLPDIAEITASLGAESPRQGSAGDPSPEEARAGFRAGFGLMMVLVALAAAAYLLAPRIAAAVPQTAAAMTAYVRTVDQMRRQLDANLSAAQRRIETLLQSVE